MYPIIETQFCPSISVFGVFLKHGGCCLEMQENYQKGAFRNRCEIIGPNGKEILSVPLKKGKNEQLSIKEVLISYDDSWNNRMINTLKTCYGSSPYFIYYSDKLFEILSSKHSLLHELNWSLFNFFNSTLNLNIQTSSSNIWKRSYDDRPDLRGMFKPNKLIFDLDKIPTYVQVFQDRNAFAPNLSILDLMFCMGPESKIYLKELSKSIDFD